MFSDNEELITKSDEPRYIAEVTDIKEGGIEETNIDFILHLSDGFDPDRIFKDVQVVCPDGCIVTLHAYYLSPYSKKDPHKKLLKTSTPTTLITELLANNILGKIGYVVFDKIKDISYFVSITL